MIYWEGRYTNGHGEYEITFASESYKETKAVERLCQMITDGKIKSLCDFDAVVRCKDCIWWNEETDWDADPCCCLNHYGLHCHPNPDDYCSYGERRANNG